jgi:hypothetical protein
MFYYNYKDYIVKIWTSIIIHVNEIKRCNTVLFKKSIINVGISLHNNVPDQIKLRENVNF